MNEQTIQKAWDAVCSQVKTYEDTDISQVNAIFPLLHPQAMSEGFLLVTAESEFIRSWVEKRYVADIKRALQDLYGCPFTVIVEVDVPAEKRSPAPPAAPEPAPQTSIPRPARGSEPAPQPAPAGTDGPEGGPHDETQTFLSTTSTYTFENFVIGDSNRTAYTMAVNVAEAPGHPHRNPLFIYGKSGLGKTHLLRAIQNYVCETRPELKVVYTDAAELLNDYTDAGAAHEREKESFRTFRSHYENADVLLVDDVQYLQRKSGTLDALFQIFNSLTNRGRQVVLSADRAPRNIDIDERYKSRFNSGATFDIQPPEVETKLGIIKIFIEEYQETEGIGEVAIPDDVRLFIAESSGSNIRELKSAVTKIIYKTACSDGTPVALDEAKKLLENHFSGGSSRKLTVADIQRVVEGFYRISHADLVGKKRTRDINYARQMAIYLCRQLLDLPYNDIGKRFNRDHSTIMHSVSNVEGKLRENRELQEEVEVLQQLIRDL